MKPIFAAVLGLATVFGTATVAEASPAAGAYERVQQAWADARGDAPRTMMPELISEVFGIGDDARQVAKTPEQPAAEAESAAPAEGN